MLRVSANGSSSVEQGIIGPLRSSSVQSSYSEDWVLFQVVVSFWIDETSFRSSGHHSGLVRHHSGLVRHHSGLVRHHSGLARHHSG